jgi:hypothetical protein
MEEIQEFMDNIQLVENNEKFPKRAEDLTPFEKWLCEYAIMQEKMLENALLDED